MSMEKAQWSTDAAWQWLAPQPWLCGFNYIPANAISYTEMWMDYSFDPAQIDSELQLAQDIGFNCIRVVLPFVVWAQEAFAFKQRFRQFLDVCHKRGLRVVTALFDDCCFGPTVDPVFGPQPKVIPGWYGNGWTPSPGHAMVRDPNSWSRLQPYVEDIIGTFGHDERVLVWDVYNEPTNGVVIGKLNIPLGHLSIPLVENVYCWARRMKPQQPLTLGVWNDNAALNDLAARLSDITTFHHYGTPENLQTKIHELKKMGRPVICTEWLNRGNGSTVAGCLPIFQRERVGALHWGLVNGKTQTHLNWGHLPGDPEPRVWQHDLFHPDHTAYDPAELQLFRTAISLPASAARST